MLPFKKGSAQAECSEALTVRDLLLRHGVARVQSRIKVRVVCARAYHALFMYNMMIRPTEQELAEFGTPDFTIFNAGAFPVNRYTSYMSSSTSVDVNLRFPACPYACACVRRRLLACNSTHYQSHSRAARMVATGDSPENLITGASIPRHLCKCNCNRVSCAGFTTLRIPFCSP